MNKLELIEEVLQEPIEITGVTRWLELGDGMDLFPHFSAATKFKAAAKDLAEREVAAALKKDIKDDSMPAIEMARRIAEVLNKLRKIGILDFSEAERGVAAAVGNEAIDAYIYMHHPEVVEWAESSSGYVREKRKESDRLELSLLLFDHMQPEFSAKIYALLEIKDLDE